MRPNNFRHDRRRAGVVEVSMAEYLRSKQSILKKIRRRLIILGILIGLTAIGACVIGGLTLTHLQRMVIYRKRTLLGITFRHLYFIYGAISLVFSFHGFYIDGHWHKMKLDGNRLVMHLRLYSLLGVVSWAMAVWLGASTIDCFGLIDVRYLTASINNIVYLITLILVCTQLVITPWLLRTIHRKASQADEYFGAEFMDGMKRGRRPRRRNEQEEEEEEEDYEDEDAADIDDIEMEEEEPEDDEDNERDRSAVVVPAPNSPRGRHNASEMASSPTRNRRAFFNADGTSTVVNARNNPSAASPSPRGATSPRSARSPRSYSARSKHKKNDDHEYNRPPVVADRLVTSSAVTDPDQIPFASPVFLMDTHRSLPSTDFWRMWKQNETTGSFSCLFKNQPKRDEVQAHITAQGFHVVAIEVKDNVLQCYFYAHQYGSNIFFLCEFVCIYSRRFFQATFKCKERDVASEFVTRFNLQELLEVEE